jgi:hypothetical protein
MDITSSDSQSANAKTASMRAEPARHAGENVMMGSELQWAHRENNSDGFSVDDVRVQFSFKYSFGYKIGG